MSELTIADVLPHAEPMILLDRYLESGGDYFCCEVTISPECQFYDEALGGVPSYVGIEYMAQTISAFSGVQERRQGRQPKVGFFLGTRKYAPKVSCFSNGEVLRIEARAIIMEGSGVCVFECSIHDSSGDPCVKSKINVFQPESLAEWVGESL